MTLKAPDFWRRDGFVPMLLEPFGWCYGWVGKVKRATAQPWRATVPVLCVGNLITGGAGKTPVALDLARRLIARGVAPHILTRGYGGNLAGPVRVDPAKHNFLEVGDEALLLASVAPVWVARNRAAGAHAAVEAGAGSLILDDGFQNPNLHQDFGLIVVDGEYGFGNGRVLPAGPLREPIAAGLARARAVVLIGEDRANIGKQLAALPLLRAKFVPRDTESNLRGRRFVALAGIGRPEKFFTLLQELGAEIVARYPVPDHHRFSETELRHYLETAERLSAEAITTEKDWVRIPPLLQSRFRTLPIEVSWHDPARLESLLDSLF